MGPPIPGVIFLIMLGIVHALQIPPAVDVYVHRAGRTARAEADGLSIALVSPAEAPRFRALMAALQRPPPPEYPLVRPLHTPHSFGLRLQGCTGAAAIA